MHLAATLVNKVYMRCQSKPLLGMLVDIHITTPRRTLQATLMPTKGFEMVLRRPAMHFRELFWLHVGMAVYSLDWLRARRYGLLALRAVVHVWSIRCVG